MDFESYRPVLSGLVGGLIATWLAARWAKTLPKTFSGKSNDQLLREHRLAIWLVNGLFLAGIGISLAMYQFGKYSSTDGTPLLLGFGFSGFMPILALLIIP